MGGRPRACIVLVALSAWACGDDDDDDAVMLDAGGDASEAPEAGEDAGLPTARVEVHARGTDTVIDEILFVDPFDVVITEAPPATALTLRAHRTGWASEAVLTTDADGTASTLTSSSSGGTYTGVEPDGLMWSAQIVPDEPQETDTTTDLEVLFDGHVIASIVLTKRPYDEGVQFLDVEDPAIVGMLYRPPGEGPFPGLLVVGGSEGGTFVADSVGPIFASKGYATLGLAYFGAEGVPQFLQEIPLEYFGNALSYLGARPEVDPERMGVWGVSRGGELALLLGAHFPSVHAVVAVVPSGLVWPGLGGARAVSGWTLAGEPLPFVPPAGRVHTEPGPDDATMYVYRPFFETSLEMASDEAIAAATIPVESTAGPILTLSGDDDQIWPSCTLAGFAEERLAVAHAQTYPDEHVCYPEAGHGIWIGGLPALTMLENDDGTWMLFGGTARGVGRAARDATTRYLEFLAANLGGPGL